MDGRRRAIGALGSAAENGRAVEVEVVKRCDGIGRECRGQEDKPGRAWLIGGRRWLAGTRFSASSLSLHSRKCSSLLCLPSLTHSSTKRRLTMREKPPLP